MLAAVLPRTPECELVHEVASVKVGSETAGHGADRDEARVGVGPAKLGGEDGPVGCEEGQRGMYKRPDNVLRARAIETAKTMPV